MNKLALFPVLFLVACLFAGIYGAVHNQISYTVAPEYFTQFKFHQFQIDDGIPPRVGAALVGWNAAWWMGIVIGLILIPLGFGINGPSNDFWSMIRVFGVVVVTTMVVGLAALGIAFMIKDADTAGEISPYGNEITDDVAFARAGTMHNFSYLGGLIGIITGGFTIFRQRRRFNNAAAISSANAKERSGQPTPP